MQAVQFCSKIKRTHSHKPQYYKATTYIFTYQESFINYSSSSHNMHSLPSFIFPKIIYYSFIISFGPWCILAPNPACLTKCGSLEVKYPLGTGYGCGSPRFHPIIACTATATGDRLLLTTHTGSYPITSISYSSSTITISPPCMSNCTFMQTCPTILGLDWASPFQLGPSIFILLSCDPSISSLTTKDFNTLICDPSSTYLCASVYTCPAVVDLGMRLFPSTNTCCVYSPANLDSRDEFNLHELNCAGYTSVVSLGDVPSDPMQWEYGMVLKYNLGGLDSYNTAPSCRACELSGGVCGYAPPHNSFVCVCQNGVNTTTDCYNYLNGQWLSVSSTSHLSWKVWWGILAVLMYLLSNSFMSEQN
ncbi:uncharacterized protein [Coffea arabica]|uniref:non-specific serine/threonine protein kinase n=1 Tax=Coffea arabica TaxID=13443 RepID=A0A6P6TCA6_COFAR|nr:uncharacterized protein LOC113699292 [Coffea arabica]